MVRLIFVVLWLTLAVVVGMWADLWHSYGIFFPLFLLLCSPPAFAVVALLSGRMRATEQVKGPLEPMDR